MHDDDEVTTPDPAPPRRWTPSLRARRGDPLRQTRHRPGAATIVISVSCPTAGCSGRLQFGPRGNDQGLVTECATCQLPFVLSAGDVALRPAHDVTPQGGAG